MTKPMADERSLIVVDPWHEQNPWGGKNQFKIYTEDGQPYHGASTYSENLEVLLRAFQGKIFVFDETTTYLKTDERIKLQGVNPVVFPTRIESSEPLGGWDFTFDQIGSFSKNVVLAGGYLNKGNARAYWGCAGNFYRKLKKKGFEVELAKGCCYTNNGASS